MLEAIHSGLDAGRRAQSCDLAAITMLTSLDGAATAATLGRTPGEMVSRLTRVAADAGAEAIVCAVKELGVVAELAPGRLRIAAGISGPAGAAADQRTTAGAAEALRRGADLLIVGRAVVEAPDPVLAVEQITASLERR
jgi:orotidine-5'-phosphate decarboxylase